MNNRLIIFTRVSKPGTTKTRLIPELGEQGAAELQREMTEHTVRHARKTRVDIEIRYTGGSEHQMHDWLGDDLTYIEQGGGDLGERMQRAFEDTFSNGWKKAIIVGSDCPSNDWKNINDAFQRLESNDCVIGPASDGGYYLIGLRNNTPEIFRNIDWGGENVFEQTVQQASGMTVNQLPVLDDVDLVEDIPSQISIIIPTLNEEGQLASTLAALSDCFNVEIIIVDGGSTDGTRLAFPNVLECHDGRAAQLNLGASKAKGEVLLFLHADTELQEEWDWEVRKILSDQSVALGAFTFKICDSFSGKKLIEWGTNRRARKKNLPYGDQGLFIRKSLFEKVGGFPGMPIMEDYAFVRLMRRYGKITVSSLTAVTSGRRWVRHGAFKVTVVNQMMIAGYRLGISTERLAAFYRKK